MIKEKGVMILSILKKTEAALEVDNLFFYDTKEDLLHTNKLEHPIDLNDIKDIADLTGAALLISKKKDEIIKCRSFIFEGENSVLIAEAIKTEERCYGVLICFYKNSEALEMKSLSLKIVAANILLSLINYGIRKEHASIISSYDEQIIRLMISSMEIRDTYTRGHSERVSYYSEILGKLCGVEGKDEEILKMAALFHDIGKIGIPDMILLKPGKLTQQEYRMIQLHPVISGDIIGQVKQLRRLVPAIKYHHERWDAGGYPDGLKGTDIPYLSRIISVADVMDAVLTTRPYRNAFSDDQTRQLLIKEQGKQFDPEIATIAIDNFDELKNYATRHKSTYSKFQIAYPELDIWRRIYFDIDYATGLLKPEIFDKQMNKFKKENRPFRLFMIDLENLGKINLKQGIAEGDKLIKNIAVYLNNMQTKYGFRDLARYGGDSFAFIMLKEDIGAGYDIEKISLEIVKILNETGIKLHITSSDFPENHSPLHYAKNKLHNMRK